ncbi:MAG TPA: prolyl oligopeptidase family serine peptidase, partial [Bacteroidia bacterium]|nr:prolyl oligopeptidase family serine peptidase [Bacteroidia bacterium]
EKDGFFYSRYDAPEDGVAYSGKNEFHKVFYHKIGTPQSKDVLIFEDKSTPLRNFSATVSTDEKFLFISSSKATSGNDLIVRKSGSSTSAFINITSGFEFSYSVIDNIDDHIVLLTNDNAPKNKLVEFDFNTGKITTLIPEQNEVLISAVRSSNRYVCHFMKDASSRLVIYKLDGTKEKEIDFPTYCTVSSLNGNKNDSLLFYGISSFTFAETIFKYNMLTGNQSSFFSPGNDFNSNEFETRQVFFSSKDGTRVPMFIVMKKGTPLDGNNPLLLFGYGGFNISKTPEFITERLLFLENGGIFALPNIRGGGEYGEAWHKAGTKLKKQNVFDDFIAAAEYLIHEKYTNSSKLAIGGRSNGGLLVGAVMTQRPELFKVALPAVGVMDMLRFHKFTIGWAWTNDYGSSDDQEQFKSLYSYSPLHNIRKGKTYPATLVTTADHDDRVVPAHSFKFISTLQENQSGTNPVLIRVDVNAGHGIGKPISKLIDEQADIFSFLMFNLGMNPYPKNE